MNTRRAVITALVAMSGAIGAIVLVLSLARSSDSIEIKLGDEDFRGISAVGLATEIADNGPVLFPDLVGKNRPIWVTHEGPDSESGWYAFLARVPSSAGCIAQWNADAVGFVNTCDTEIVYPPDGEGLEQLKWNVVSGELRVLINTPTSQP